jgi:hypothetical protein
MSAIPHVARPTGGGPLSSIDFSDHMRALEGSLPLMVGSLPPSLRDYLELSRRSGPASEPAKHEF